MKRSTCFVIAFLIVVFDQATKYLVRSFIDPFETIRILPFLQLVSVRNEGAAFGLFRSFGNDAFIVISAAAIMFVSFLILKSREDGLGLSLILGGAAGNLIDRVVFKSVIDFVDLHAGRFHWPAFNVADSALTVGLVLLVLRSMFHRPPGDVMSAGNRPES
jgi:signal peptidase II